MSDDGDVIDPQARAGGGAASEGSVTVVGTAHVSEESVTEVEETIDRERPDVVAVELDRTRYERLKGEEPDDIDGKDPEPVTTASLTNEDGDDTYTGKAAFLEPGTYTVAFTCNPEDDVAPDGDTPSDKDAADDDDTVTFQDAVDREVKAGETATYDLPLSD